MKHFSNLSITVLYVLFFAIKAKMIIKCHAEKNKKLKCHANRGTRTLS